MREQRIHLLFISLFLAGTLLLFLMAHRETGRVSDMENRYFEDPPQWREDDGSLNPAFFSDFDDWISDNIRMRSVMVSLNARLQYHLFHRITKEDERANAEGELFYVRDEDIKSMQRADLLSREDLRRFTQDLQFLQEELHREGATLYYMLCPGKPTVYPERILQGVRQTGEITVTEQVGEAVLKETDVPWIPVYETLMEYRNERNLYYRILDPAHWNEEGIFLGHRCLIDTIREDFPEIEAVNRGDYEFTQEEVYRNIYGLTYPIPEQDVHVTRSVTNAREISLADADPALEELLTVREHTHYLVNEKAGNDRKILFVGDSYQRMYLKNLAAEHFAETLSVDSFNYDRILEIVRLYHPDIVILENVDTENAMTLLRLNLNAER